MKLMLKVMLPVIILMVLSMGISNYVFYSQSSSLLNESVLSNMRSEVEALRRSTKSLMESTMRDMNRTAKDPSVVAFMKDPSAPSSVAAMRAQLEFLMQSYPAYSLISLVAPTGTVLASSSQVVMGVDLSSRDYFKKSMTGIAALSAPFYSEFEKAALMVVSAPVLGDDGKPIGIAYASINLADFFKSTVTLARIGKTSIPMVLNENGIIVSAEDSSLVFNQNSPYKDMARSFKEIGYERAVGMDGKEAIFYYAKEPFSNLVVCLRAFPAELFAGLESMKNMAILIALAGIALNVLMIFFIQRPVIQSLNLGVAFARKVAAGDLNGELSIKRNDEIGNLAEALRSIPASLKEILQEYKTLEKEVEGGNLSAKGESSKFSGEFATLIDETNGILERFRAVLEEIPSPVAVFDKDLGAMYLNAKARAMSGDIYVGKSAHQLFALEDYKSDNCALKQAAATKRSTSAETAAHAHGQRVDVSYAAIPMLDKKGSLLCVLQLLTDLTSIKETQRTILDVAHQASGISTRVATASEELSSQADQVNRGMDIQRDRIASTATAMDQMNSTVLEVARNAADAKEQAESTRDKAREGAELVERVVSAVNKVNTVADELQGNMQELGRQAEAIGGVMSVISDIADQTNLLALNAAIEAARAGEAGRGFAVVADEVRKLAEKTMGATSEVGTNIRGVQTATAINIDRTAEVATTINEATELARTSGRTLGEILTFANTNSALIASIAAAAEEQSATSEEIGRSIDEVNSIANETASGMSESAAATQALASLALELNTLLDRLQK